jgi:FkbM family methyltransferase
VTESSGDAGQVAQLLNREFIIWAYRLLLDRDPESEEAIAAMQTACSSTQDLRRAIMVSQEFRGKNPEDLAYTPESTVVIAELHGSLRLFVDLSDIAIGLNIARGRYEPSEIAFIRGEVKPGQTVLDIGANIGFFSIVMGALVGPNGHVYAFEPVAENADLLERSIHENGMEERITLKRETVGEEDGERQLVTLGLESGALNSGGAYLLPPEMAPPPGHELRTVPIVTLDRQNLRSPVSLIKIDVEGAEPLAFRGARGLLRSDRPVILSEINPTQLQKVSGCTPAEFISEMKTLRYGCFALEDGRPAGPVNAWSSSSIRSVVFLPDER